MSKIFLFGSADYRGSVYVYPAGERHAPHYDALSRISVLLSGGYREEARVGVAAMRPGDVLAKSSTALHADDYGRGAKVLSVEFVSDDPFCASGGDGLWAYCHGPHPLRLGILLAEAAFNRAAECAGAAALDLAALCAGEPVRRPAPPVWLVRLKDELEAIPLARIDIAARARQAGAHPALASRLFRQCFGFSMTETAQAAAVRRAIARLSRPRVQLSAVAAESGFYDQSHMNRVFRRVLQRTPRQVRNVQLAIV